MEEFTFVLLGYSTMLGQTENSLIAQRELVPPRRGRLCRSFVRAASGIELRASQSRRLSIAIEETVICVGRAPLVARLLIRALARSPGTSPSSTRWMARPTSTQTSRRALHLHPQCAGGVHLD